jgi:hypothetical protein
MELIEHATNRQKLIRLAYGALCSVDVDRRTEQGRDLRHYVGVTGSLQTRGGLCLLGGQRD